MNLERKDITENVLAIRLGHSYREGMTAQELYDVTRGYWVLDRRKAEQMEYAFCIYKGVVKEVYQIGQWFPAGTVPRPTIPGGAAPEGRYEFVGTVAEPHIRTKYVGKSVADLFAWGTANPIRYFWADEAE